MVYYRAALQYAFFIAQMIPFIYASDCDCQQVSNWEDFRQTILRADQNSVDEGQQVLVKFCPFSIEKVHTSGTNFWKSNVPITRPMNIVCEKNNADDACEINIVGPSCGTDQNCGRNLFAIRSDNVYLDGFRIKKAKDNIVTVFKDLSNVKLIDMQVYGSSVPPASKPWNELGLIVVRERSNVQIISSTFNWNSATVLHNSGTTTIYSTNMNNNRKWKDGSKTGAIYNKSKITLIDSNFHRNEDSIGSAIYSENSGTVYDGGLNCSSGQVCNGVHVVNGNDGLDCILLTSFQCSS